MKLLTYGSRGPQVQFLQLALNRADCGHVATDGIYGYATTEAVRKFQRRTGIAVNGTASQRTQSALLPYYTGYLTHVVGRGDTLYNIARRYHTSLHAIETANAKLNAAQLRVGSLLTVPLSFPVVPTGINWSSDVLDCVVEGLCARYPFLRSRTVGRSAMGKPLYALTIGSGQRKVFYNGTHHANEWITTPVLMKFTEQICRAYALGISLGESNVRELWERCTFVLVPMVNPDGVDLVTGEYAEGSREYIEF